MKFFAEWSAGELLQYYGGVLAFAGTVILGALSLHQNEIIKQESDKRIAMQEKREHDSNKYKTYAHKHFMFFYPFQHSSFPFNVYQKTPCCNRASVAYIILLLQNYLCLEFAVQPADKLI